MGDFGEVLRTPDKRFEGLTGFDFAPHYLEDLPGFEGLRLHHLDEGPADAPVALCLHGQPSWCYLYRKMLPAFRKAGMRVVAPDLFGFGRSDKPVDEAVYTFDFHRDALLRFVERLGVSGATLVCQDWGGLLGLTLPMDLTGVFSRLIVMNTALGTGDVDLGDGFRAWRDYSNSRPDLNVPGLLMRGAPGLTEDEAAAYGAPFPDIRFKAGVRRFPNLVPDREDAPGAAISRRAREFWRHDWDGQSFMAIGMRDPVLGPHVMQGLRKTIRNCPAPLELAEAGHFVQEAGAVIVERAMESFGTR